MGATQELRPLAEQARIARRNLAMWQTFAKRVIDATDIEQQLKDWHNSRR